MHHRVIVTILALTVLACTAALTGTPASASSITYTYDNNLRWWVHNSLELASQDGDKGAAGKQIPLPVEVRCYDSGVDFDRAYYDRTGHSTRHGGNYTVAFYGTGNTIDLRTLTCSQATRFTQGIITPSTADAFSTLLHEALHRQGFEDEHLTEKYALGAMYAAGDLARYNSLLNKGYATPSETVTSKAGSYALYLAVDMNNAGAPGEYRVTKHEAEDAKLITWAAIV